MRDFSLSDTIAAIATPPGEGAIAVVRLSGKSAIVIADKIFRGKMELRNVSPGSAHYGRALDERSDFIDEVVATVMHAPYSYTGEDTVEISCHGGYLPSTRILNAILRSGAREAERGEFTLRAFLNNRIDLTRAEAVADLVASRGDLRYQAALNQLSGKLFQRLAPLMDSLRNILAIVEIGIDFTEEDIELTSRAQIAQDIKILISDLDELASKFKMGRIIKEGYRVAIAGKVNTGKSSLLNKLLDSDRAIVTAIPGTTRDTITETIAINGLEIYLTDTAGFRNEIEIVEGEGIKRAMDVIKATDLCIVLLDPMSGFTDDDRRVVTAVGETPHLMVLNKKDLYDEESLALARDQMLMQVDNVISALTGENIESLKQMIYQRAMGGEGNIGRDVTVTNRRHYQCLIGAIEELDAASSCGAGEEILALHLRLALNHLGEITGEVTTEEILNSIFDGFCIGK